MNTFQRKKKNHFVPCERNCGQAEGKELDDSKVWRKNLVTEEKQKRGEKEDGEHRKDRGEMRRKKGKKIIFLAVPRSVFCCTEYNN